MDTIIEQIIKSYSSLWKTKIYGKTIEIITPSLTTNDCFVSVFLTERENGFIITDGGWINKNYYNTFFDSDDEAYSRLFQYYVEQYSIKETEAQDTIYYYKITPNKELIPNLVLEMSTFISSVVSSSFINFKDAEERTTQASFRYSVNNYIASNFEKKDFKFNGIADERYNKIKFNAVITKHNKLSLVNYVTGTNDYYFKGSIARSNLNFQLINNTFLNNTIHKRITIINNEAPGYTENTQTYINIIPKETNSIVIPWREKEKVLEYIN